MKIGGSQADHDALPGVSIDDHHDRDHASEHATGEQDALTVETLATDGSVVGWKPTFLVKAADEVVNNSSTLQDDDDFTFAVLANTQYLLWGLLMWTSASAADIKFEFSLPSGATVKGAISGEEVGSSGEQAVNWTFVASSIATFGGSQVHQIALVLNIGGTPGTAVLKWAQKTANGSDTKLFKGSWMGRHAV